MCAQGLPSEGGVEILPLSSISPEAERRTHPTSWVTVFTTQLYFNYISFYLIAPVLCSISRIMWTRTVGDGAAERRVDSLTCWPISGPQNPEPKAKQATTSTSAEKLTAHRNSAQTTASRQACVADQTANNLDFDKQHTGQYAARLPSTRRLSPLSGSGLMTWARKRVNHVKFWLDFSSRTGVGEKKGLDAGETPAPSRTAHANHPTRPNFLGHELARV